MRGRAFAGDIPASRWREPSGVVIGHALGTIGRWRAIVQRTLGLPLGRWYVVVRLSVSRPDWLVEVINDPTNGHPELYLSAPSLSFHYNYSPSLPDAVKEYLLVSPVRMTWYTAGHDFVAEIDPGWGALHSIFTGAYADHIAGLLRLLDAPAIPDPPPDNPDQPAFGGRNEWRPTPQTDDGGAPLDDEPDTPPGRWPTLPT